MTPGVTAAQSLDAIPFDNAPAVIHRCHDDAFAGLQRLSSRHANCKAYGGTALIGKGRGSIGVAVYVEAGAFLIPGHAIFVISRPSVRKLS